MQKIGKSKKILGFTDILTVVYVKLRAIFRTDSIYISSSGTYQKILYKNYKITEKEIWKRLSKQIHFLNLLTSILAGVLSLFALFRYCEQWKLGPWNNERTLVFYLIILSASYYLFRLYSSKVILNSDILLAAYEKAPSIFERLNEDFIQANPFDNLWIGEQ